MHVLAKPVYHYDQVQFTCRPVSQQEVECWHEKAKENKHKHFHNYFQLAMQLLNKSWNSLGIVCQGVVTSSSLDSQILCNPLYKFYYFSWDAFFRQSRAYLDCGCFSPTFCYITHPWAFSLLHIMWSHCFNDLLISVDVCLVHDNKFVDSASHWESCSSTTLNTSTHEYGINWK